MKEMSVEVVNLTAARPGPPLPWKFSYHCIAKMGSKYKDHVIMIGGHKHPNLTLIGATKSNSGDFWAKPSWLGPKLLQDGGRRSHSCTHIKHNNGSHYVIVAGGYSNVSQSTSEILNTDLCNEHACPTSSWYPGEDFCRTLP